MERINDREVILDDFERRAKEYFEKALDLGLDIERAVRVTVAKGKYYDKHVYSTEFLDYLRG